MQKKLKSFTLLEIVISIALFTIITLLILGIFSKIVQTQYEIYDTQTLQNNVQYLIEVLSKEARMAKRDEAGTCLGVSGRVFYGETSSSLNFLNYKGECIHYGYNPTDKKIYKSVNGGSLISVTSKEVEVNSAIFSCSDETIPVPIQPLVYFSAILSNPNYEDESKKIKVQTTISARVYH